jgi:hypothetical protein
MNADKGHGGVTMADFLRVSTPEQVAAFLRFLGVKVPHRLQLLLPEGAGKESARPTIH